MDSAHPEAVHPATCSLTLGLQLGFSGGLGFEGGRSRAAVYVELRLESFRLPTKLKLAFPKLWVSMDGSWYFSDLVGSESSGP